MSLRCRISHDSNKTGTPRSRHFRIDRKGFKGKTDENAKKKSSRLAPVVASQSLTVARITGSETVVYFFQISICLILIFDRYIDGQ